MFFKKKSAKDAIKCEQCNAAISKKYSFCPYCGESLHDEAQELEDFGMLGRSDVADEEMLNETLANNFTFADKLIGSLVSSIMKNIDMQLREVDTTEVKTFPNGIKIKVGAPMRQQKKEKIPERQLTEEQRERLNVLPRSEAKTNIRRFSDKIIYELTAPGVQSAEDIFVSKLESGYEIKAIGKNKVYVNSVPINLPLKRYTLHDKGLTIEFSLQ